MKSLLPLAAAAALFFGVYGQARADQTIGHWTIKSADQLCDASGLFQNGTRLELDINSRGALIVSVVDPKWNIPAGQYSVEMQIDRSEVRTYQATVGSGRSVMWVLPFDEESLNLLSYGKTLKARIGSVVVSYDLAYSGSVVKALGQCAATYLAPANPFANAAPLAKAPTLDPFSETTSNPYRRM